MLTIEKLITLKDVIKWHTVFSEAGLNASTMRSAMYHRRALREDEVNALTEALSRRGLLLTDGTQYDLFARGGDKASSVRTDAGQE